MFKRFSGRKHSVVPSSASVIQRLMCDIYGHEWKTMGYWFEFFRTEITYCEKCYEQDTVEADIDDWLRGNDG